jgi:hypothetical protein
VRLAGDKGKPKYELAAEAPEAAEVNECKVR